MKRVLVAVLLMAASWLAVMPAAEAHPLGNFTANRYAELVIEPGRVTIRYALDLAEIPSFQTLQGLAPDGEPSSATLMRWADRTAAAIADRLVLRIDGRRSPLSVDEAEATTAPGQGGLATLRLDATFRARLDGSSGRLSFADRNDPGRLGWREIVARGSDGIVLTASDVPAVGVTDGLRSYPDDLLSAPLDVTSMRAWFGPGSNVTRPATSVAAAAPTRPSVLDGLLARPGAVVMLLGLVVASVLGAWHALLPGHGKTLMAAAVVGGAPRPRDAVVAGISVAGMHTVSVIALGLVIVVLEQAFRPEAVYPWLRIASGVAAVGVGVHLVRRRWRGHGRRGALASHAHRHDGGSGHGHDHDQDHEHEHEADRPMSPLSRPGLAALALAGGILPSPSALLVLLASLQRGRAVYGLSLVLAFSVGLAASLILVALAAMRARHVAERRSWTTLGRVVPIASAAAVVVVGLVIAGGAIASL